MHHRALCAQTACEFDAGRLDSDGKPQTFRWSMLYDVVRQLVPTPEHIFMAWSQSLDYNIGTAAHTFAAMTSVCEVFGINIQMWMTKPPSEPVSELLVDDKQSASTSSDQSSNVDVMPKRDDPKYADDKTGQIDYDKDILQWKNIQELRRKKETSHTMLPHFMGANGASKKQVEDLVVAMERQRRATSAYRHRCSIGSNSDMDMNDPSVTIERIMNEIKKPLDVQDALESSSSSHDGSQYMPLYSSCIMANAVQTCNLYSTQALAKWLSGETPDMQTSDVGRCGAVGTMRGIHFSKSKRNGACVWNTAWMRPEHDIASSWNHFAKVVSNSSKTCKIFDLPVNGMRDLVYLLSTRDNNRRCTEEPHLPYLKQAQHAFMDSSGTAIGDGAGNIGIYMRGIQDSRMNGGGTFDVGVEAKPRHPYSGVHNVCFQRALDFAMNACRIPAMLPVFSNNVTDSPPLRVACVDDDDKKSIELNTAAALEHTKMIAEGILRCSTHPGLQNEHERFCGDTGAPPGLCCPSGFTSNDDNIITKLPYSYDIMTIALTLDAMSRYYDPMGRAYARMFTDEYRDDLGLDVKFEDLPHMSLRFVGLKEEVDRRLLSHKVPEKNSSVFGFMEVGEDMDDKKIEECHAMVSMSLGHHATKNEVLQYLKSRSGSRSMSGVRGDMLSMETWLKHSHTVLMDRGMVSGPEDVVMGLVADEPYQLRTRVTERASDLINKLVDAHPRMEDAEEMRPGDDLLSVECLEEEKNERRHRIRTELYDIMPLPGYLDDLRHCGPLRITSATDKRTYHNTKTKKRSNSPSSDEEKHPCAYNKASLFANTKKTMQGGLPSKKNRKEHDGVFSRGQRDSRSRG